MTDAHGCHVTQETVARLPLLQRIPIVRGNPARLTASLAESICVRAALKPVTFTFKLWASYKVVLAFKRRSTSPLAHIHMQTFNIS
jgi:hypothetical protein